MNTEEVRNHIKELLDKKNIKLREASLFVGQNEAYMHQFFSKRSPLRLPEHVRRKLALLLCVDESEITDISVETKKDTTDLVPIEIIDAVASCGKGAQNFNPVPIGKYLISLQNLKDITASSPENIKIIRARGDSMEPTINDSDVIWVDISYQRVDGDGIYLFRSGSQLLAKRARVNLIDGSVVISSDNTKYPPFNADSADEVSVIGKIISINKMLG